MSISVKNNNQWRTVGKVYTYQNAKWKEVSHGYTKQSGKWQQFWQNVTVFINDIPQTSISIYQLMGSPKTAGDYIFINNAEIIANNGEIALRTGFFPTGSNLMIINNSYIKGYGGNGGLSNTAGQDGGEAILIESNCTINNTNGHIFSGGGGGGGLAVICYVVDRPYHYFYMGGGGGYPNGKPTENFSKYTSNYLSTDIYKNPSTPDMGTMSITTHPVVTTISFARFNAETGAGGSFGQNGTSSKLLSSSGVNATIATTQKGGKAGLAIKKNGFNVTLINTDEERIKGEIL